MRKLIKIGSDFSGVGAFDFAMQRVAMVKQFDIRNVFACDMDKYARLSYLANHPAPLYYPENVYEREIPSESLDVYTTSPPCQSFSLAGNRKGESDDRGLLFYNSHEFIKTNKPRFFIFENVKGLISDSEGATFRKWKTLLGGKSINGNMNIFPHEEAIPYHIYHKVLNSKDYGVPQNRERVFIIGIRDDEDNNFRFPIEQRLTYNLKDVLEPTFDEKYILSKSILDYYAQHKKIHKERGNGFKFEVNDVEKPAKTVSTKAGSRQTDNYIYVKDALILAGNLEGGKWDKMHESSRRYYDPNGIAPTIPNGAGGNHHAKVTVNRENDRLIRKLTPRECFRLQDFSDSFKFVVSDSQLYKQAGNSITIAVLEALLMKLKL